MTLSLTELLNDSFRSTRSDSRSRASRSISSSVIMAHPSPIVFHARAEPARGRTSLASAVPASCLPRLVGERLRASPTQPSPAHPTTPLARRQRHACRAVESVRHRLNGELSSLPGGRFARNGAEPEVRRFRFALRRARLLTQPRSDRMCARLPRNSGRLGD